MTASTPQLTPSFFNRSYTLPEEKGLVYKVDTIDVNSSPSYAGDFPTFEILAKVSQVPLGTLCFPSPCMLVLGILCAL